MTGSLDVLSGSDLEAEFLGIVEDKRERWIRWIIKRYDLNHEEAEDAYQIAVSNGFQGLNSYDQKRLSLLNWFGVILRNAACVYRRDKFAQKRDPRRVIRFDDVEAFFVSYDPPSVEINEILDAVREFVCECIDTEKAKGHQGRQGFQRLYDIYFNDLSVGDIACRDGCTNSAVTNSLAKARKALFEKFEPLFSAI